MEQERREREEKERIEREEQERQEQLERIRKQEEEEIRRQEEEGRKRKEEKERVEAMVAAQAAEVSELCGLPTLPSLIHHSRVRFNQLSPKSSRDLGDGKVASFVLENNQLVQHHKQHHGKVLLSSFHLNGHTLGFHPNSKVRITL